MCDLGEYEDMCKLDEIDLMDFDRLFMLNLGYAYFN